MILHAANIDAASQKLAFAGAFIAKSIEVLRMAAIFALLKAEAILAADIAVCIGMAYEIFGTAARAVLINSTRLAAFFADAVAKGSLAAVFAHFFNDALQAVMFLALVKDAACMFAAIIFIADHLADDKHAVMMAVLASAFFCFVRILFCIAARICGSCGHSTCK